MQKFAQSERERAVFISAFDKTIAHLEKSLDPSFAPQIPLRTRVRRPHRFSDLTVILKNLDNPGALRKFYGDLVLKDEVKGHNLYTLVSALKKIRSTDIGKKLIDALILEQSKSNKSISCLLTSNLPTQFQSIKAFGETEAVGQLCIDFLGSESLIHCEYAGQCCRGDFPVDVGIFHELVHAYNWLTDLEAFKMAAKNKNVPKCFDNREELRTISGVDTIVDELGERVKMPFSENAYREAIGEFPRISHRAIPQTEFHKEITFDYFGLLRGEVGIDQNRVVNYLMHSGFSLELRTLFNSENFKKINQIKHVIPLAFLKRDDMPKTAFINIIQVLLDNGLIKKTDIPADLEMFNKKPK